MRCVINGLAEDTSIHWRGLLVAGTLVLALGACASPGPTAAVPSPRPTPLGADLGSSSRIPQVPGLAGEGEGYDRPEPGTALMAHGPMPGLDHGSMAGMAMGNAPESTMGQGSMPGMPMAEAEHAHAQGTGTVNSVDPVGRKINVSHGPIPAIGFPAMTMDFAVAAAVDLRSVKPGTRVNFMLQQGADGMYVIRSIAPAAGGQ